MLATYFFFNLISKKWIESKWLATKLYRLPLIFFLFHSGALISQSQRIVYSEADREAILLAHNKERKLVGNQDLIWDYDLEEFAANWANTLSERGAGLSHRPNNKYGENCYWSSTSYVNPEAAILAFNEEKEYYNYGPVSYQNFGSTGHYTQVVWYRTTKVGCAAVSGNSGTFVVCNYNPPGNLIGDYPYNNSNVKTTPQQINNHTEIQREQGLEPISIPITPKPNTQIIKVQTPSSAQDPQPIRSSFPAETPQIMSKPVHIETVENNNNTRKVSKKEARKQTELKNQPFVYMFSGVETWTRFNDMSLISQMKLKQRIGFTGASSVFELSSTLPKSPDDRIRKIRGVFSIGVTLSNRTLQNQFGQNIGNDQWSPRLYSPIFLDFGLQCWKHLEVNFGQTMFGLMGTSDKLDFFAYNRCSIRFVVPMGRNLSVLLNGSVMGRKFDVLDWNMASFGVSVRSKFY